MIGGKRIAKNTLVLMFSSVFNVCVSIFTTSIIARSIGPELYGRYTFSLNYILFFRVFANFGLESLFIREAARDNKNINLINDIFHLKFFLAIINIGIIILSAHLLKYSPEIIKVIYILCIGSFFQILYDILLAYYRSIEKLLVTALFSMAFRTISAIMIVIAIYTGIGFIGVVSAFSIANALIFASVLSVYLKKLKLLNTNFNPGKWFILIKQGLPFYASALLTMFYYKINVLILSKLVSEREMGSYFAAVTLVENLVFIPNAFNTSIFPAYSRIFGNSMEALKKAYERITKYTIIFTVAVAIGTILVGEKVIELIYGKEFTAAAPILSVFIFFWVFTFFSQTQSSLLFSIQKEFTQLKIMVAACFINLVLSLILIYQYGIIGAAYASVLTEGLVVVIVSTVLWKLNLRYKPDLHILGLSLVAIAMSVVVKALLNVNIIAAVAGGGITYLALLFLLRVFDSEDIMYFKSLLRRNMRSEQHS